MQNKPISTKYYDPVGTECIKCGFVKEKQEFTGRARKLMAHACNPSTLGGWDGWVTRSRDPDHPGWHGETLSLLYLGGWGGRIAWTQEAEVAVSQDCATALQPGDRARLHLKKWKRKEFAKECCFWINWVWVPYFLGEHTGRRTSDVVWNVASVAKLPEFEFHVFQLLFS